MSDNLHVYSGIFVDEKGQRFLQILEASVDSVFEEVYSKTMPQNPNLFKECLSRVSAWDRSVIQEEMQKMKVYIDSDDVFKDAYVSYVKSMRASSQKKILINLPHFNEFLQQYWKRVADSRVMQSGRFFNGNAIDRKIICMDAARDVLYSFLNDDTVTLEDKSDVGENDSYSKDQYELPNKHSSNPVSKIPLSKPLSHVSLSKSLRPESVPPFFRGNDDFGENDSIITPNDSISQINVPTRLQRQQEKQQDVITEENDYGHNEEQNQNMSSNACENSDEQKKEDIIASEHDRKTDSNDKYNKHNEAIENEQVYQREEKQKEVSSRQDDVHRHEGQSLNEHRSESHRDNPVQKEEKPPSVVSLSTISLSDNGKITMKPPSSSVSHKSSSRRHEHQSRRNDDDTSSVVSGYDQHKDRDRHKKRHHEKHDSMRERNDSPESDVRSSHRKQIHDKNYDNRSSHSTSMYRSKKNYAASEASNSDCTTSSAQNYRSSSRYNMNDNVSEASSVSQSNHSRVQVKPKKSCLSHISDDEENSESD